MMGLWNWKTKLVVAIIIIILVTILVPNLFSDVFNSTKDAAIGCDKAARDIELPKINEK